MSVDRLASELTNESSKALVHLDPDVMEKHGIGEGDVIRISTPMSRAPIPARVGEPYADDRDSGIIRLDRFMRSATKAKINQKVEVSKVAEVPILETVHLLPPIDVSTAHHLLDHLTEALVNSRAPLARDSILYANFHHSVAGTTYRVVKVKPDFGIVGPDTNIHVDIPTSGGMQTDANTTYEDVGGMGKEIKLLRELVHLPLQFPQVYRQLGINAPRGVIFYGPPGSGKTYLARALANEVHAGFYYINGPDV